MVASKVPIFFFIILSKSCEGERSSLAQIDDLLKLVNDIFNYILYLNYIKFICKNIQLFLSVTGFGEAII